jgi:hypothetical protein
VSVLHNLVNGILLRNILMYGSNILTCENYLNYFLNIFLLGLNIFTFENCLAYDPKIFAYDWSFFVYCQRLILWLKRFYLCYRFGLMVEALLHVLLNFNFLKIECFLFPSFSFLTSLTISQTYLIFQKKIKLKVLCQFAQA